MQRRTLMRRLGPQRQLAYAGAMQLHGSTEGNLIAAVRSAIRLRTQPVHADTIRYWTDLLHHARREISANAALASEPLTRLVAELEVELVKRPK